MWVLLVVNFVYFPTILLSYLKYGDCDDAKCRKRGISTLYCGFDFIHSVRFGCEGYGAVSKMKRILLGGRNWGGRADGRGRDGHDDR